MMAIINTCKRYKQSLRNGKYPQIRYFRDRNWRLAVLFLVHLAVTLSILRSNQAVYHKLQHSHMDPLDEYYSFPESPVTHGAQYHVVFFGDSRAKMWPDAPGLQEAQFWNRGIGGHTCKQTLLRWDVHVKPLLQTFSATSKRFLVLQVGVNDLKNVVRFPSRDILGRTQLLLKELILLAAKDFTVIVTTVFPTGDCQLFSMQRLTWSHRVVAQAINETNMMLREFVKTVPNAHLFDAASFLAVSDPTRVDGSYQLDLLHLNAAGYKLLNSQLATLIFSLT